MPIVHVQNREPVFPFALVPGWKIDHEVVVLFDQLRNKVFVLVQPRGRSLVVGYGFAHRGPLA